MRTSSAARIGVAAISALALVLGGGVAAAFATGIGADNSSGPATGRVTAPLAVPVPAFQPNPVGQLFTAVAPCRIVDTRVAGGPLSQGTTRSFNVSGTSLSGQGGNASGCNIPSTAAAVALSIIAVNPSTGGFLTLWPAGTTKPTASVLNFAKGVTSNTGQTTQVTLAGQPALSVFTSATTQIVIDVYGYYEAQMHLIIMANGQVWYGNGTHLTSVTHTVNSGIYILGFDRSTQGCNVLTDNNTDPHVMVTAGWGAKYITVQTYLLNAGTLTQSDQSFQIFVTC